ncbi:putative cytochrome P450 [Lachnellula subtilissima]|uniref:Putative cytochrome P450 n=1 Tax=Lachnellula subtilissima TaxID=602034 RepID=A0A8H8UI05_9HELO|nr:putative cytochrome P450 [Lachnellula subtilissima]
MAFILVVTTVAVSLLAWYLKQLYKSYNKARHIGLPLVLSPFHPWGLFWMLGGAFLGPLLLRLPFGLGEFVNHIKSDGYYLTRNALHQKHGPAFIVVSPGCIQIVVGDGAAVEEILTKRHKEFPKSELYQGLKVFGNNLETAEGDDWRRHRKLTVPPFNERNSNIVWRASLTQARGMLKTWVPAGKSGIICTASDMMTVALHVLTSACFGKDYSFQPSESSDSTIIKGEKLSFKVALGAVLDSFLGVVISSAFPKSSGFLAKYVSKKIDTMKFTVAEFKRNLREMIEEERAVLKTESKQKNNLMSALVRACDLAGTKGDGKRSLTEEELYGNLFIFTFAGHDTTANALMYATALIAANKHVQSWIKEEIHTVIGKNLDSESWEYEKLFPRLRRCLAVMYETTRMYGPVVVLPKSTGSTPSAITIQGKEYTLPAHSDVMLNMVNIHHAPEFWGPDPWTFRPERWIIKNGAPGTEELLQPPYGSYMPWATGARVCPGKKFSQVEFVAVIASLFQRHGVQPVPQPGETVEMASKELSGAIEDSECVLTLKMRHPEKARLAWEADA